jgi:hypothetical protein
MKINLFWAKTAKRAWILHRFGAAMRSIMRGSSGKAGDGACGIYSKQQQSRLVG